MISFIPLATLPGLPTMGAMATVFGFSPIPFGPFGPAAFSALTSVIAL